MWRLFALAAMVLLAPPLQADIHLENVHACYGRHAPERPCDVYYLHHDTIRLRFDVVDARYTSSGVSVHYEMKLLNGKREVVAYSSSAMEEKPGLDGDRFRGYCELPLRGEWPAGVYKVGLMVADYNSGKTSTYEKKVRVQAAELAVVGVKLAHDVDGPDSASTTVPLGQTFGVCLKVTGLQIADGKAWCRYQLHVLDGSTRQCVGENIVHEIHDSPPTGAPLAARITGEMQMSMSALNRPGDFILHIQITDVNAHKSIDYDLPLHVVVP